MICFSCERDVKKEYNYCPYCGKNTSKESSQNMLNNDFNQFFEEVMGKVGGDILNLFDDKTLKVFINGKELNFSKRHVTNNKTKLKQKRKIFPKKKVVEPLVSSIKDDNGVSFEISLPGVKTRKNISLTEFEKSIEVLANTKNKTFFTTIKKPGNSKLRKKRFKKNTLLLRLE